MCRVSDQRNDYLTDLPSLGRILCGLFTRRLENHVHFVAKKLKKYVSCDENRLDFFSSYCWTPLGSSNSDKDLISKLVCSIENKDDVLHRWHICPNQQYLESYLFNFFRDFHEDLQRLYSEWGNVHRSTLSQVISDVPTFIEKLVKNLEELCPY